jgi:hypothetical protein
LCNSLKDEVSTRRRLGKVTPSRIQAEATTSLLGRPSRDSGSLKIPTRQEPASQVERQRPAPVVAFVPSAELPAALETAAWSSVFLAPLWRAAAVVWRA